MSAYPMVTVSGARLAEVRKELGLTQSGLGKATGLPRGRISEIELGHAVRLDTLRRYVAGLGGQVEIVARVGCLWLTVSCPPSSARGEAPEDTDGDAQPSRVSCGPGSAFDDALESPDGDAKRSRVSCGPGPALGEALEGADGDVRPGRIPKRRERLA